MSERRKAKTLFSRKGQIWIDDKYSPWMGDIFRFQGIFPDLDESDYLMRDVRAFIRQLHAARRESKAKSYATLEDLHRLEGKVKALEYRLNKTARSLQLTDINAAVSFLISQIEDMKRLKKISYQHEDKNLDFFLVTDQISSDLLERISEIEIALSRKFPKLSVEIELVHCDEEIPEKSRVVLVKR